MALKIERRNVPLGIRLTPSAVSTLRAVAAQYQMAANEVIDRMLTRPLEELGELLVESVAAPLVDVAGRGNPGWVAMRGRQYRNPEHLGRVTGRATKKGARRGKAK